MIATIIIILPISTCTVAGEDFVAIMMLFKPSGLTQVYVICINILLLSEVYHESTNAYRLVLNFYHIKFLHVVKQAVATSSTSAFFLDL